ncbi:MAG: pyruvate, phosphate dikinase, partial [Clostridiales bacterium]|nr:pyruvate, phosphate dikinase [Clostridiales bacterium]
QLDTLLHPNFDEETLKSAQVITTALPASPGAAAGALYFTAADAAKAGKEGKDVILVREETTPEDIEGMDMARGILTARGGMTSHAAVVARGMGRPAIVGAGALQIDDVKKTMTVNGKTYSEGDEVSLDGTSGKVYEGLVATVEREVTGDFAKLMGWADKARTLKVRTNADTPRDTQHAVEFGAEGIGLCRTEHMFFEADRVKAMREMILSDNAQQRKAALDTILPFQQKDFEEMYTVLEERPMTVRYLDPPLHEFLPQLGMKDEIAAIAKELGTTSEAIVEKINQLHETNPMMGHRGCRLAVTFPEIAEMQTRAVLQAALKVRKEKGIDVKPEIMIPLVGTLKEFQFVKKIVMDTAEKIFAEQNDRIEFQVGTMIEIPRACVVADKIATEAEFFSFGTNDLTQMAFGFSRDDAGKFLESYYTNKILESDPFARLDQEGVGALMKMAVEKGRSARPTLKLGICGEHGGDPSTIEFCHQIGLDYVSCSPFRVPIARLAAAQAAIKEKQAK